jgi:hypothetical protein
MPLSKEEKDELAEHYKNRDLYDPSKAPEQQVRDFAPQGMNSGGMCGYAEGGSVMEQGPIEALIQGPLDEMVQGPLDSIGPRRDASMVEPDDLAVTRTQAAPVAQMRPFVPSSHDPVMRQGLEDALVQGKINHEPAGESQGLGLDLGRLLAAPAAAEGFSGPSFSADTQTARGRVVPPSGAAPTLKADLSTLDGIRPLPGASPAPAKPVLTPPVAPLAASKATKAPVSGAAPAQSVPKGAGKLSPSEFDALIQALQPTKGQQIGQAAMLGLAGLADAIETGVARTNGSNFQKSLVESQSQKRNDLINALKAKYEANTAGQRLAEEARAHRADEETNRGRLAEDKRAHDLEAGGRAAQLAAEGEKINVDAAQRIIEAYEKGSAFNPFSTRPSEAEYNAAKKVLQSGGATSPGAARTVRVRDSSGRLHDLPAVNLAKAKQRDPGLQVVQ